MSTAPSPARASHTPDQPARLEQLEPRMLLSASIPAGFGELRQRMTIDLANPSPTTSAEAGLARLEDGASYFLAASGVGRFGSAKNSKVDADWIHFIDGKGREQIRGGVGGIELGLDVGNGSPRPTSWGGYDPSRRYVIPWTGAGEPLAAVFNDRPTSYGDNSGSYGLSIWEQIQLQGLRVSDSRADIREVALTRGDDPGATLTVPQDRDGTFSLSIDGTFNDPAGGGSRYRSGTAFSQIRYELKRGAEVVDSGSLSDDDSTISEVTHDTAASYTLTAWYDGDSSGALDGKEEAIEVEIEAIQLAELNIASTRHEGNSISVTPDSGSETLFVELEDNTDSTSISFTGVIAPSDDGSVGVIVAVTGPGLVSGEPLGLEGTVDLFAPGASYEIKAGFDLDESGTLDEGEEILEASAVLVEIETLSLVDDLRGDASLSVEEAGLEAERILAVGEEVDSGVARVQMDVLGSPLSSEAGQEVLWRVSGGPLNSPVRGNMGGADPLHLLSAPNSNNRLYIVDVGFDDNGNGMLDPSEVSRTGRLAPVRIRVEASQIGPLTLMEEVTYKVRVFVASGLADSSTHWIGARRVGEASFTRAARLRTGETDHTRIERVAGNWEWAGAVGIGGRWLRGYESGAGSFNGPTVEVRFPDAATIAADADVLSAIATTGNNTVSNASPQGWAERGFWIRLDTSTGEYRTTSEQVGPPTTTNRGTIVLGPRPADSPAQIGIISRPIYTVASFHTHAPSTYLSSGRWPVGPSPSDFAADASDDVAGLVLDYVEAIPGSGTIPAGWGANRPSKIYFTQSRRMSP